MGMSFQRHDPAALTRERPATHCIGGWALGPVWTGSENLALTGIRSSDRPARSESLYRPRYLGPYNYAFLSYIILHYYSEVKF
jgi:hypothetical protein